MSVSFDVFIEAFTDKVTEYKIFDTNVEYDERVRYFDSLLHRACAKFSRLCKYDLNNKDKTAREFCFEVDDKDIDELVDIISEGMVEQWLKPYANNADNMENIVNTADFSQYSPAELLRQVRTSYNEAKDNFKAMITQYTYSHGDLTDLHI